MEGAPQRRVSLIHLSLEPACQKLSLVDMALVTVQRPSATITRESLLHNWDATMQTLRGHYRDKG